MLGRLFTLFVLLAVSLYIVKFVRTKLDQSKKHIDKDSATNTNKQNNKMVKCQYCGLHIPESEAIRKGDTIFCSLEHAKQEL